MILVNGTMSTQTDTLFFHYGSNNRIEKVEKVILDANAQCSRGVGRLQMLCKYANLAHKYNWEDIIDFGLDEKVVTQYTSFIVLERVEDYIKYNIAAPKDLEEECERLNYVRKDTRPQRVKQQQMDELSILQRVAYAYNENLKKWNPDQGPIVLDAESLRAANLQRQSDHENPSTELVATALEGRAAGISIVGDNRLDEVVVVGYGTAQRKSSITGSVEYVQSDKIFSGATTVENILQGRIAGLNVETGGAPGAAGNISIRGMSSLVNNSQPLYVLDGVPVSGNINNVINTNDIESITILKDATATSLYGSRGSNGVIVITSKRGRRSYYGYSNNRYKLKDMEDVDYLHEIRDAPADQKLQVYDNLRSSNEYNPGFYFDMAQYFFECGMLDQAKIILMDALEIADGESGALRTVAYLYENWKQFNDAIDIYQQLVEIYPFDLDIVRNLALAHYQAGHYQQAVDILYLGMRQQDQYGNTTDMIKATMLADMNAIITMHKDSIDTRAIPSALIVPLQADLRIVVDCNHGNNLGHVTIKPPSGKKQEYFSQLRDGILYATGTAEFQFKKAQKGKYRIRINTHDYYGYTPRYMPTYLRIVTFRNFGKPNQSIEIENISLQYQDGDVEVAEIVW